MKRERQRQGIEGNLPGRRPIPYDPDELERVYKEEGSLRKASSKLSMSHVTLERKLRESGKNINLLEGGPGHDKAPELTPKLASELYLQGLTLEQIAERYDLSKWEVSLRLQEAGTPRRSRGPKPRR
ncbi:hypothetical protein HY008_02810 [Candidatus Woesebacteria bacterium]|nr:hypothetical protein [Candidatus Woesebacteria bacterium]